MKKTFIATAFFFFCSLALRAQGGCDQQTSFYVIDQQAPYVLVNTTAPVPDSLWWIIGSDTLHSSDVGLDSVSYWFSAQTTPVQLLTWKDGCPDAASQNVTLKNVPAAFGILTCPAIIDDECNYVCHGGFENYVPLMTPFQTPQTNLISIQNAFRITYFNISGTGGSQPRPFNTPDLWNGVNTPLTGFAAVQILSNLLGFGGADVNANKTDAFVTLGSDAQCDQNTFEAVHLPLHTALPAGTYEISMEVASGRAPVQIHAVLSQNPPINSLARCILSNNDYGPANIPAATCSPTLTVFQSINILSERTVVLNFTSPTPPSTLPPTNLQWQTISGTFSIGGQQAGLLRHLIVHLQPRINDANRWYAIDNVVLRRIPELSYTLQTPTL